MARPTPGRVEFYYLESWLLPSLGLRANVFHFSPGFERDQDFYLDVGRITAGDDRWHSEDHYLDLVVRTGRGTDLVDVDDLLEAHRHGLLATSTAQQALQTAACAIDGLATHGHDLGEWLADTGIELTWH